MTSCMVLKIDSADLSGTVNIAGYLEYISTKIIYGHISCQSMRHGKGDGISTANLSFGHFMVSISCRDVYPFSMFLVLPVLVFLLPAILNITSDSVMLKNPSAEPLNFSFLC